MVVSLINPEINYIELKRIHDEDRNKELDLYELEILNENVVISIGNIKNDFIKNNISYFPIYLIKKNNKGSQIGLFEIKSTNTIDYFDEKGNLLIEKINDPLLYSFITPDYLNEHKLEIEKEVKKIPEKKEIYPEKKEIIIPKNRIDIFDFIPSLLTKPIILKEETNKAAKKIRRKYYENSSHSWIQKYMKNPYYFILDVDLNKDCLFSIIKEVFQSIGQQTTIQKIRNKLGEKVSDNLFQEYRDIYSKYERIIQQEKDKIQMLKLQYDKIQKKLKEGILNRDERIHLIENGKELYEENEELKQKKKVLKEIIDDFLFMKDVHSTSDLRKKVKSCDFWREEWSLSMLEFILNIKFIILNYNYYKENDIHNVLECNKSIEELENNVDGFNPEYYILLEKIGKHYKIIGYKNKIIFTYLELPFDLKLMIKNKCLEQKDNSFRFIPEFQTITNTTDIENKSTFQNVPLFDKEIVFSFYENSGNSYLPGKGPNEKIPGQLILEFSSLAKEKQWRKKLSNFWNQTFLLDGKNWASVVHYIEASKFKNENRDFYDSFSLDSGSDLSKDAKKAWYASHSKNGLHKGERLRDETIKVDSDFNEQKNQKLLLQAQMAKFSQNPELKQILLKTKNAMLVHQQRKQEPVVYNSLMLVREKIQK